MNLDISGVEEFKVALQRLDAAMQKKVHDALEGWAEAIEAEARKLVPVRTGYLQSTIYAKVKEWMAEVGAEASYALFVEFGTRYMRAHPFLWPAIQKHLPELESIVIAALEMAKAEAGL